MMAKRRTRTPRHRVVVTCYDPAAGESVSMTLYPQIFDVVSVAKFVNEKLAQRFGSVSVTDLNDGRHKRR